MRLLRPHPVLIPCALAALTACDGGGGVTEPTTGSLQISFSTTGRVPDRDGYMLSVDGGAPQAVPVNDTHSFPHLSPGAHTLTLSGVADNCQAPGGLTQTVQVAAGGQAQAQFSVQCAANRVAYAHLENGVYSIFVRRFGDPGHTRVANTVFAARMDWSPDGYRLLYVVTSSNQPGRMWIADIDSGTTRQLQPTGGEVGVHPAWSPDGRRIAFSGGPLNARRSIYTVNPDGTDPRALTPEEGAETMPAWSPDGARIAYRRDAGAGAELWVMDADGTDQRRLAPLGSTTYTQIDWLPDGRIVYSSQALPGTWDVHAIRPDGTGAVQLTHTPAVSERYVAVLPDGRISYNNFLSGVTEPQEIWIMNADGTGVTNFTNTPAVSEAMHTWQ